MDSLLSYLTERLKQPLPGEKAQFEMAPKIRQRKASALKNATTPPRESAVLVLLYPKNNQPHILLTKRNDYDGTHSGQVSFPGGKKETEDIGLIDTALRETKEEIGISKKAITVLGELTDLYIPPSNFIVQPYIGLSEQTLSFTPDPTEVKEVIEFPLSELLSEAIITEGKIKLSTGVSITSPYFLIDTHIVWGATAMMLSEFKSLLKDF